MRENTTNREILPDTDAEADAAEDVVPTCFACHSPEPTGLVLESGRTARHVSFCKTCIDSAERRDAVIMSSRQYANHLAEVLTVNTSNVNVSYLVIRTSRNWHVLLTGRERGDGRAE